MCQVFKGVAPFVNCIFRLNSVFYLPFCTFTKWYVSDMFEVFSVIEVEVKSAVIWRKTNKLIQSYDALELKVFDTVL